MSILNRVYSFDDYPHANPGHNYIKYTYGKPDNEDEEDDCITIVQNGKEQLKIAAFRDQWGVWITFAKNEKFTIAQEDGTKSFLDGLIKSLQLLKERNENGCTDN